MDSCSIRLNNRPNTPVPVLPALSPTCRPNTPVSVPRVLLGVFSGTIFGGRGQSVDPISIGSFPRFQSIKRPRPRWSCRTPVGRLSDISEELDILCQTIKRSRPRSARSGAPCPHCEPRPIKRPRPRIGAGVPVGHALGIGRRVLFRAALLGNKFTKGDKLGELRPHRSVL